MGLPIIRYRGPDGQIYDIPAIRGAPGVSPTVEIAQAPGGTEVTITDAQGGHTFLIPNPAVPEAITEHIEKTDNPHGVTAAQVGLGNVDNTSDMEKPISTAQQAALDGKSNFNHNHSTQGLICYSVTCTDSSKTSTINGPLEAKGMLKIGDVNVGYSLPTAGNAGRIFFKRV